LVGGIVNIVANIAVIIPIEAIGCYGVLYINGCGVVAKSTDAAIGSRRKRNIELNTRSFGNGEGLDIETALRIGYGYFISASV
jgi:hypothetical protein